VERSDTHQTGHGDMTDYRRNFVVGGSFFFTVNLADRRLRLLTEHIDELRAAFRETRHDHPFTIDAMVVLPDHLHAVRTMPDGDADFAKRWRLIKTGFSRRVPAGERISESRAAKANAEYGSGVIGSTPFVMKTISPVTSTTSTSTRSSMAT
jgi:REP element-mobilizing transposase RayT